MIAEPKRWMHDGSMRATIPSRNGVVLECVFTSPPSSKGRNVILHIPDDMVDEMLIVLRDAARDRRAKSIGETNG